MEYGPDVPSLGAGTLLLQFSGPRARLIFRKIDNSKQGYIIAFFSVASSCSLAPIYLPWRRARCCFYSGPIKAVARVIQETNSTIYSKQAVSTLLRRYWGEHIVAIRAQDGYV